MASIDLVGEAESFIASYREAFQRYDLEAIVDHYLFPTHFVSDAAEVALLTVRSEEECRKAVQPVLAWHRELGVVAGRVSRLEITELSPRMASVDMAVAFHEDSGAKLYDYRGIYTLVRKDDRWRVAAISHNQIPRLLKCLSERRTA